MKNWNEFPHDASDYAFEGDALEASWEDLHTGDKEPYPEDEALADAWRAFHRGDFQQAVELADAVGIEGHAVANKATGIYATYLEENSNRQVGLFKEAIDRAEAAIDAFPDDANAHYFHAFNLGRYSQSISIVKALSQGIGGKIQTSLQNALNLEPAHAEASTAMGMYHAEIVSKVGKMLGKMTYGASPGKAIQCFDQSLELTPGSPIAHIEYGNGLYLLYEDDRIDDVSDVYIKASELEPMDASGGGWEMASPHPSKTAVDRRRHRRTPPPRRLRRRSHTPSRATLRRVSGSHWFAFAPSKSPP